MRAQESIDALAKSVASEFGALDILVNCAGYVANGSVLDCTVRNVSETGAMLEVLSALAVPREFELRWGNNAQRCIVVWRKLDRVSVKFEP